jgi:hypothetical protein
MSYTPRTSGMSAMLWLFCLALTLATLVTGSPAVFPRNQVEDCFFKKMGIPGGVYYCTEP